MPPADGNHIFDMQDVGIIAYGVDVAIRDNSIEGTGSHGIDTGFNLGIVDGLVEEDVVTGSGGRGMVIMGDGRR